MTDDSDGVETLDHSTPRDVDVGVHFDSYEIQPQEGDRLDLVDYLSEVGVIALYIVGVFGLGLVLTLLILWF